MVSLKHTLAILQQKNLVVFHPVCENRFMRKAKLPKRELEICQRLRFAREEVLETTQANCAEQIGLDRSTLANYESLRTPLRYDVALRFCRQFIISEEWLATGRHDSCHVEAVRCGELLGRNWEEIDRKMFLRQCVDLLSDPASLHIKPGTLFSEAYDKTLASRYAELVRRFYYTPLINLTDADKPEIGINFLNAVHDRHLILLDHEALRLGFKQAEVWRLYVRRVFECSDLMFRKILQLETGQELKRELLEPLQWLREVSKDPSWPIGGPLTKIEASSGVGLVVGGGKKNDPSLTDSSGREKLTAMSPQWPALKKRLQKAVERVGARAALVKVLNVDPTQISQWLSESKSAREPGGDYALQLLKWVELQERQAK